MVKKTLETWHITEKDVHQTSCWMITVSGRQYKLMGVKTLERLSLWSLQCEEKKEQLSMFGMVVKCTYKKEEIEAVSGWVDLISDNKMKTFFFRSKLYVQQACCEDQLFFVGVSIVRQWLSNEMGDYSPPILQDFKIGHLGWRASGDSFQDEKDEI